MLAAGDADLIILEGMGRGIETNLHARFRVDALKLGMIKHKEVGEPCMLCALTLLARRKCGACPACRWRSFWVGGFTTASASSVQLCDQCLAPLSAL